MSVITVSIISILCGILILAIRLFLFVDMKNVDKPNLKRIQANSFALIILGVLFLVEGIILLLIYYKNFIDPIGVIVDDLIKIKAFFSILIMFLGIVFIIYKERIFDDWKKNGYKVPAESVKYRTHIILVGMFLLIGGLIILIL